MTVRHQHASTFRGVIVGRGIKNFIIVALRAEIGAMDKRTVGCWRGARWEDSVWEYRGDGVADKPIPIAMSSNIKGTRYYENSILKCTLYQ